VYEPITLQIDRAHGEGAYRSYSLYFVGRLINIVEAGQSTMRLYEWADRGRLLYPFINTHSGGSTPTRGNSGRWRTWQ
jgi:hypothetical protein